MRRFLVHALAVAATLTTASPVLAGPDGRSERVRYADLDLSSPDGRRVFDRRIGQAIKRVCSIDVRDTAQFAAQQRCLNETRARANIAVASVLNRRSGVALAATSPGPTAAAR